MQHLVATKLKFKGDYRLENFCHCSHSSSRYRLFHNLTGDAWTVPVVGCILTALIATAIPSKLGRPLLQLDVYPQRAITNELDGPFKSGSSRTGSESDCSETQDEGSGELDAKLSTFPPASERFQASFVPDGEPDILCDQCVKDITTGQFQICWVQMNSGGSVTYWFHGDCFPTHCCQEGIEEEAIEVLIDWASSDAALVNAVEAVANTLLSFTAPPPSPMLDDSQPNHQSVA